MSPRDSAEQPSGTNAGKASNPVSIRSQSGATPSSVTAFYERLVFMDSDNLFFIVVPE